MEMPGEIHPPHAVGLWMTLTYSCLHVSEPTYMKSPYSMQSSVGKMDLYVVSMIISVKYLFKD